MNVSCFRLAALALGCWWSVAALAADAGGAPAPRFAADIRPLLDTYCGKCHGDQKPKAGLNLRVFDSEAAIFRQPKVWENIRQQVADRAMPPEGKKQPTAEERVRLLEWIEHTLENPDPALVPRDPGHTVIHRLSRLEYNSTIRDLLGVDTHPADRFPPDGGGGAGFDNNASTLFIPPVLMEQYIATAGAIVAAARPERIFVAVPGPGLAPREAARRIIDHFVPRAYRRPALPGESADLLALYDAAVKRGESHDAAVRLSVKAMLVSPHFLFRVETEPSAPGPQPVNDHELASRLSYFIWSSMPDDELRELAGAGRLREPAVLAAQVRRLLADPRGRTLADNFVSQWLRTRELKTVVSPDHNRFKTYTTALRDAMYDEPVEFFHDLVLRNGGLTNLLDSNYTFANALLAVHYGLTNVTGDRLQRVSLTGDQRGGLLGMGGVLTLTSYPLRTSPVLRGKWVMEEILGTPPPPPPPLVKSLPPDDRPRDGLSLRQRLEEHRKKPDCMGCHSRMDPLGFGLENFDAIGRWRTKISGSSVDASGRLVTGEQFTGPAELRRLLLKRSDDFTRNVTEKLLAYALGRGLEYYDAPTVKQIARGVARDGHRTQDLIQAIVASFPFTHRRGSGAASP